MDAQPRPGRSDVPHSIGGAIDHRAVVVVGQHLVAAGGWRLAEHMRYTATLAAGPAHHEPRPGHPLDYDPVEARTEAGRLMAEQLAGRGWRPDGCFAVLLNLDRGGWPCFPDRR